MSLERLGWSQQFSLIRATCPLMVERSIVMVGEEKLSMLKQLAGYVLNLRQWLKSQRPGVVFCNDMRGLLTMGVAARLAGIPVVIWDKLDKTPMEFWTGFNCCW